MRTPIHRNTHPETTARGGSVDSRQAGLDLRCGCHRLLTRAVAAGIELRCPRCKTDTLIGWERIRELEAEARLLRTRR